MQKRNVRLTQKERDEALQELRKVQEENAERDAKRVDSHKHYSLFDKIGRSYEGI